MSQVHPLARTTPAHTRRNQGFASNRKIARFTCRRRARRSRKGRTHSNELLPLAATKLSEAASAIEQALHNAKMSANLAVCGAAIESRELAAYLVSLCETFDTCVAHYSKIQTHTQSRRYIDKDKLPPCRVF